MESHRNHLFVFEKNAEPSILYPYTSKIRHPSVISNGIPKNHAEPQETAVRGFIHNDPHVKGMTGCLRATFSQQRNVKFVFEGSTLIGVFWGGQLNVCQENMCHAMTRTPIELLCLEERWSFQNCMGDRNLFQKPPFFTFRL